MTRHTEHDRQSVKPAARQRPRSAGAEWGTELVLLVAACAGARCAALRRLHSTPDAVPRLPPVTGGTAARAGNAGDDQTNNARDTEDRCGAALSAAVRDRRDAVLLSTACLGPCHRGSVAAVGWAETRPEGGGLDWTGPPLLLCMLDTPARAAAAADWIRHGAPARNTVPALLANPDSV